MLVVTISRWNPRDQQGEVVQKFPEPDPSKKNEGETPVGTNPVSSPNEMDLELAKNEKLESRVEVDEKSPGKPVVLKQERQSKIKVPPKTKPCKKKLKYTSATLYVQLLADGTSRESSITGITNLNFPVYEFPTFELDFATKKISKFKSVFKFKGAITIQTLYGPGASPHIRSLYGRGTTEDDMQKGVDPQFCVVFRSLFFIAFAIACSTNWRVDFLTSLAASWILFR